MGIKTGEKIVDGLALLLEGYSELEAQVRNDYIDVAESGTLRASKLEQEVQGALVTELKAGVESLIESEDYRTTFVAGLITALSEALEEIDPDAFESGAGLDLGDDDDDEDEDDDDDDDDEYDDLEDEDEDE